MDNVIRFHKSRIMFCIKDDQIITSELNNPDSHQEWFRKLNFDKDTVKNLIRGYVSEGGDIYVYKADFEEVEITEELIGFLNVLKNKLGLSEHATVYSGLIKSRIGESWLPRKSFENLLRQ